MTGCSQWCARQFPLVLIVGPPLRPVIETLLLNDEATILADGFFDIRGDVPVALGALVPARPRLDVLIESSFVDVSRCHRSHRVSGTRQFGAPLTH